MCVLLMVRRGCEGCLEECFLKSVAVVFAVEILKPKEEHLLAMVLSAVCMIVACVCSSGPDVQMTRSSAYKEYLMCSDRFRVSWSTATLKRVGERTPPCTTPLSCENLEEMWVVLTWKVRSDR